ncbi:MAG: hypothetical protein AAGA48_32430 [Myxococcota bacterium]
MQWRVVAIGVGIGLALFVVAAFQVFDAIWPRPPALDRTDEEVHARWTAAVGSVQGATTPQPAAPQLAAAMAALDGKPAHEPVPDADLARLIEVLAEGAAVPHYGCTAVPHEVGAEFYISPFDWLEASRRLMDVGEVDLAGRIASELRDGQDLVIHAIGIAIYADARSLAPEVELPEPSAEGLYRSAVHAARCSDALMAAFNWDEAEDYFGQGRVPPRWWYDPEHERLVMRDYYSGLLEAMAPHRDDAAAMAEAAATFQAQPHAVDHSLVSRLLILGVGGVVEELARVLASPDRSGIADDAEP